MSLIDRVKLDRTYEDVPCVRCRFVRLVQVHLDSTTGTRQHQLLCRGCQQDDDVARLEEKLVRAKKQAAATHALQLKRKQRKSS